MTMSMTDLEPPDIDPAAARVQIGREPGSGLEYGSHAFAREITTYLGQLLHEDLAPPVYRCNPFDRLPCAVAESFTFTAAGYQVLVIAFEDRRGLPAYALHLGNVRVEFELTHYGEYSWQVARGLWTAIRDRPPLTTAPSGTAGGQA